MCCKRPRRYERHNDEDIVVSNGRNSASNPEDIFCFREWPVSVYYNPLTNPKGLYWPSFRKWPARGSTSYGSGAGSGTVK